MDLTWLFTSMTKLSRLKDKARTANYILCFNFFAGSTVHELWWRGVCNKAGNMSSQETHKQPIGRAVLKGWTVGGEDQLCRNVSCSL